MDANIDKDTTPDGCWPWKGAPGSGGYGRAKWHNVSEQAHRGSFRLNGGKTTEAKPMVLHDPCDNPLCCRPDHLVAGDHILNMKHKQERGRAARLYGTENGQSQLSKDQVLEIDRSALPHRVLAAKFGISKTQVGQIKRGERHAHVTGRTDASGGNPGGRLSRSKNAKLARRNAKLRSNHVIEFAYAAE
jgi:hypothetical protein